MAARHAHIQRLSIATASFGWDSCTAVLSRHSTLPWNDSLSASTELEAWPLSAAHELGEADRLSLIGQFAAHLAFQRLVEQHDSIFDPSEWCFTRRRGEDPRLIRVRQSSAHREIETPLALLDEVIACLGAPELEAMKQSWVRPDAVYAEVFRALRRSGSRLHNLRAAAHGCVLAPGMDALRAIVHGDPTPVMLRDPLVAADRFTELQTLGPAARALVIGGEASSPLRAYSAFPTLPATARELPPPAVAEMLIAHGERVAVVFVADSSRFDRKSVAVIQILRSLLSDAVWVEQGSDAQLHDGARPFLVAPLLSHLASIEKELALVEWESARKWLDTFVDSDAFERYLDDGVTPRVEVVGDVDVKIAEPARSCLAALSFAGTKISRRAAGAILQQLGLELPLEALAESGVVQIDADALVFRRDSQRIAIRRGLATETQELLARTAARAVAAHDIPALFAVVAEWPLRDCAELLDESCSDEELRACASTLLGVPRDRLAQFPRLAGAAAEVLLSRGRYDDARALLSGITSEKAVVKLAFADRRTGGYRAALERLASTASDEAALLRAELLRLTGELDGAEHELGRLTENPLPHLQRVARHERAMLALDRGERVNAADSPLDYYGERLRCYAALLESSWSDAAGHAARASALAETLPLRIDAELDHLYALFLAGSWDEARLQARAALSLVEETQGDRAAGGALFTLAYLCAENATWREAERHIARLDTFFRGTADANRLRELDLLRAHLAFCRGELDRAATLAAPLVRELSGDLREAAALIVDETAWIAGSKAELSSRGASQCVELQSRHALAACRQNTAADARLAGFAAKLFEFEQRTIAGEQLDAPPARNISERIQLFRSLRALENRGDKTHAQRLREIEQELGMCATATVTPPQQSSELDALQRVALATYPFAENVFDGEWLIASRNRLGRWSQHGNGSKREPQELESLSGTAEVIALSPQSFLHIGNAAQWSEPTRRAIGSIVATKIENHNTRRLLEQESTAVEQRPSRAEGIIGESAGVRAILSHVELVAAREVPALILGESGTGKELIARAIHRASRRKRGPFTPVNCAALPDNLIESELFGHVRGAFTGADRDRAGIIESTDGGTLFLDEIGELPLTAQAKLLRFLQNGEIRRVGDTAVRTADVHIVAATHRRLEQWVQEGRFREDLYFRIRIIELTLPPLRERGSDILLLASEFLRRERARHGAGADRFSAQVEDLLVSYSWPGNIRELENTIRGAHALAGDSRHIDVQHLPERIRNVHVVRASTGTFYEELTRFRRSLIEQSLVQANGNQNRAAQSLGMSRQALAYQIRELGILVKKTAADV